MNTIVTDPKGYSFEEGLARAKTRLAYYEEDICLDIAERLIDTMEARGLSRSELARRLKVQPAYVTKLLRGYENLSLKSLAKIAYTMGLKWKCVMVPADAQIGALALINELGNATVCAVKSATIEGMGASSGSDENEEYGEERPVEETSRELSIPA